MSSILTPGTMRLSLSSSTLKIIAAVTMVIDHIGLVFLPEQIFWRIIGRISFPLFALLLADGCRHTQSLTQYIKRLTLLAVLSQIPFTLMLWAAGLPVDVLNIFFTLIAGLLALAAFRHLALTQSVSILFLILLVADLFHFDYGAYGVVLVLVSYIALSRRDFGMALLALLHLTTIIPALESGVLSIQLFAVLSLPFIAFYSGRLGVHLPRRFFYAFYPVHIVILLIVWIGLQL